MLMNIIDIRRYMMKKTRRIALVSLLLAFALSISVAADGVLQGDVNGDGILNSADAIYLLRHTIMPTVYPANQAIDMNGDGIQNSADAIYLLRHTIMPSVYPLKNGDVNCDHEEVIDPAVPPTCAEAGLTAGKHCGKCNAVLQKQESVPAAGHRYEDGVCAVCGQAALPSEGLLYALSQDGTYYSVAGMGDCTDTVLVIPAMHEGLPVKKIERNAFYGNTFLKTVILPDGLEEIGDSAFRGCTELETALIPDSVKTIGAWVFCQDAKLVSVTLPEALTALPDGLFNGCKSLTAVSIPRGVEKIGSTTFALCESLTELDLPDGLKSIGNYAFGESGISAIDLPETLTALDVSAFQLCKNLTSIRIPSGVRTLSSNMFYGCDALITVELPEGLTEIGSKAFSGCEALEQITFGGSAFEWNYLYKASDWDEGLETYDIVFLKEPVASHDLSFQLSADGTYYIVTGIGKCQDIDLIIPAMHEGLPVLEIGESAFYNCNDLVRVTIEEGIQTIGAHAFSSCAYLTDVELPQSVTKIGANAFQNDISLKSVMLPQGLTTLEKDLFYACYQLESVTLPNALISIGDGAFDHCMALKNIDLPETLRYIGDMAFQNTALESISLPDGFLSVGEYGFCNSDLTSIILPDSVTQLGKGAFARCENLAGVSFPQGIAEIASSLFEECTSLVTVIIPEGVTAINNNAFRGCTSLQSITLPTSLQKIGSYVFYGVNGLSIAYEGSEKGWYLLYKDPNWDMQAAYTLIFMQESTEIKDVRDPASYHSTYAYEYLGTQSKGVALQTYYDQMDAICYAFHIGDTDIHPISDGGATYGILATLDYAKLGLTKEEANAVWAAYVLDHPIYYWIQRAIALSDTSLYILVDSDYYLASTRAHLNDKIYAKIAEWVSLTVNDYSAYDLAMAYHDLIIEEINYAYKADGRTPEDAAWAHNIVGVLTGRGEAVCEGYAKTFQLLLNYSNVENVYVNGYAGGGHAWNMVRLDDGGWYWCDLTWDDEPERFWGIDYNYFCVNSTQNVYWYYQDGGYIIDQNHDGILDHESFTDSHTPDPVSMDGMQFMYPLPEVSGMVYDGTLRDTFEVDGLRYAISGYRKVQLTGIMRTGYVQIPETVSYNGVTYSVNSIGAIYTNGIYLEKPIECYADSIYIPKTVKYIWDDALDFNMPFEITVDSQNPYYYSVGGKLYQRFLYTVRQSAKSAPKPKQPIRKK